MIRFATPFLVFVTCATAQRDNDAQAAENALRDRATEYIKHLVADDYAALWELARPDHRAKTTLQEFARYGSRKRAVKSAEIRSAKFDGPIGVTTLTTVCVDRKSDRKSTITRTVRWREDNGQLYFDLPKALVPQVSKPKPEAIFGKPAAGRPAAPAAPELNVREHNKGFHTRGQWRGNPAVADLDQDGNLDLVTSLRRWDRQTKGEGIFVYLGDGSFGFTPALGQLPRDMGYGGAAVADIDRDGNLDIAFSGHDGTPRAFIHEPSSDGPQWIASPPNGLDTKAICADVALGDFDRDGNVDLVTIGQFPRQGRLLVWHGDGTGAFAEEPTEILDQNHYGSRVDLIDMDGDGHLELLAAIDVGAKVYRWDPETKRAIDEFKGAPELQILGSDLSVAAHDFDRDGTKEFIVSGYAYDGKSAIRIYRFADGAWHRWGEGLPDGESFFDVKVGRLSDTEHPVLFAGGQWGICVIDMLEPGKFKLRGRIPNSAKIFNIAVGDMNGDGSDEVFWIGEGGVRMFDLRKAD